ncbi:prolyl-tRNA editing enzyme YbaK/EbsC (Cys-tRNA(Pro) deacylase) [Brevibacterium pityocampae]
MTWSILPDTVTAVPARDTPELVAAPTAEALAALPADLTAEVFPIDPDLADTAALTEAYGLAPEHSANCVLVAGTRAGDERIAACLVLAHTRADVNKRVHKLLDVRKASFLPMDRAVEESGMEYGGIGPIGLPEGYRLLVDARVVAADEVIIGSGIRGSKIILPGSELARLPGAEVIEDLALEV